MKDFEAIYQEHYINVYRYTLSLCCDEALAEEITQETFYRAFNNLDHFDGKCRLYVWLCQIAKNHFFTYRKKSKRYLPLTDAPPATQECPESIYIDKETVMRLQNYLNDLPDQYKKVFNMRVFGELPFTKIGEIHGKTDSWARLVFYRAKKELRRKFDENTL